jgi:undecaprenyl-diphosphatase
MILKLLATVVVALWSRPALCIPQEHNEGPITVDLAIDLPLLIGAGTLGSSLFALREQLVTDRCAPHCDAQHVNALDRTTLGDYRPGAATAGDILILVNVGLPLAFDFAYQRAVDAPWRDFLQDGLIVSETLAINMALHQLVSITTQRPRPFAYRVALDPIRAERADTYLSFYSGHTANSFAVATATSYLFSTRYPKSSWRVPLWVVSHGLATVEGYTRIAAGYHHFTDVFVGAVMGSAVGLIVPALHRNGSHEGTARITPMPVAGGALVALTWTTQ